MYVNLKRNKFIGKQQLYWDPMFQNHENSYSNKNGSRNRCFKVTQMYTYPKMVAETYYSKLLKKTVNKQQWEQKHSIKNY
jgi:hypothetical protein